MIYIIVKVLLSFSLIIFPFILKLSNKNYMKKKYKVIYMNSIIADVQNWNIFFKIMLIVSIIVLEKLLFYNNKLNLFRNLDKKYKFIRNIFVILLPIISIKFLKTNIFIGIFLFIINSFFESYLIGYADLIL